LVTRTANGTGTIRERPQALTSGSSGPSPPRLRPQIVPDGSSRTSSGTPPLAYLCTARSSGHKIATAQEVSAEDGTQYAQASASTLP
jgi:hypothetical protein